MSQGQGLTPCATSLQALTRQPPARARTGPPPPVMRQGSKRPGSRRLKRAGTRRTHEQVVPYDQSATHATVKTQRNASSAGKQQAP